MSHPSLGFVGGGRVARIMLGGWQRANVDVPTIVVCEPDDAAFAALASASRDLAPIRGDAGEAGRQQLVFLAVHPPKIAEAAAQVADSLSEDGIVVSLAPKVTLAKLRECLGGFARLARMIPNAPSLVGRGYNPIAWSEALDDADQETIRALMRPLGELPEVPETTLEAYAVVAAMGPTYFWPQWLELESLAVQFGLTADSARRALYAMTTGALETLDASSLMPDDVLNLVPVKPLADFEPALRDAYRSRLTALMEKIHP